MSFASVSGRGVNRPITSIFLRLVLLNSLLNVEPTQQYLAGVPFRPSVNAHHRITTLGVILMSSPVVGKMVMRPKSPIKGLSRNGVIGTGSLECIHYRPVCQVFSVLYCLLSGGYSRWGLRKQARASPPAYVWLKTFTGRLNS